MSAACALLGACVSAEPEAGELQPIEADRVESTTPAGGRIDFLGFEGADTFFGAADEEIEELGITFQSSYMGTPADISSKFARGGGDGLDLLAWPSANHDQFRPMDGVLSPIAPEEVPNLEGLIEQFRDDAWGQFKDDNGDWLAIPFSFGPIGITYNQTEVRPSAYVDLLVPELKGQVGAVDSAGLHVLTGSAALGYDPSQLNQAQLDEVMEFTGQMFGQTRVLSRSFGDAVSLLNSGEIVAVYGGRPGLGAFGDNPDLKTVFPAEGSFAFVDVYSIPAGADNREAALAFINAMLEPATNARINDAIERAVTVQASIGLVSEANRLLYPYEDLDHFFGISPVTSVPHGARGIYMTDVVEAYSAMIASRGEGE